MKPSSEPQDIGLSHNTQAAAASSGAPVLPAESLPVSSLRRHKKAIPAKTEQWHAAEWQGYPRRRESQVEVIQTEDSCRFPEKNLADQLQPLPAVAESALERKRNAIDHIDVVDADED